MISPVDIAQICLVVGPAKPRPTCFESLSTKRKPCRPSRCVGVSISTAYQTFSRYYWVIDFNMGRWNISGIDLRPARTPEFRVISLHAFAKKRLEGSFVAGTTANLGSIAKFSEPIAGQFGGDRGQQKRFVQIPNHADAIPGCGSFGLAVGPTAKSACVMAIVAIYPERFWNIYHQRISDLGLSHAVLRYCIWSGQGHSALHANLVILNQIPAQRVKRQRGIGDVCDSRSALILFIAQARRHCIELGGGIPVPGGYGIAAVACPASNPNTPYMILLYEHGI